MVDDIAYHLNKDFQVDTVSDLLISHVRFTTHWTNEMFHFFLTNNNFKVPLETVFANRVIAAGQGNKLKVREYQTYHQRCLTCSTEDTTYLMH